MIIAIVAYNSNYVIGDKDGKIPWKIQEETLHFKKTTMGSCCIMGRKTWDLLPFRFRPLSGRVNIVVTRKPGAISLDTCQRFIPVRRVIEGPFYVSSVEAGIALAKSFLNDMIFIIGGAEIYKEAIGKGMVDQILASEVFGYKDIEPGAFFPVPPDWNKRVVKEHQEFSVVEYKR